LKSNLEFVWIFSQLYIYKGQSRNVLLGIVHFGVMIWLSCTQEIMRPSLSLHAMTTPLKKY